MHDNYITCIRPLTISSVQSVFFTFGYGTKKEIIDDIVLSY